MVECLRVQDVMHVHENCPVYFEVGSGAVRESVAPE